MYCGLGAQQGVAAPVRYIRGQKRRSRSIDLSSEGAADMLLDKQPMLHSSEQQDDGVTLKQTLTQKWQPRERWDWDKEGFI